MNPGHEKPQPPKTSAAGAPAAPRRKQPYQKPAFECEQVFETLALSCGKISATQAQCKFNRKNS